MPPQGSVSLGGPGESLEGRGRLRADRADVTLSSVDER